MDLLRYFHTLRYLRPVQIYGRLWHQLNHPKPSREKAPELRTWAARPVATVRRESTMVGPHSFRFLNHLGHVTDSTGWNDPGQEKLWLYNLHYFADLVATSSVDQSEWHRNLVKRWITENPAGRGNGWEPYPLSLRIVNWIKWHGSGQALWPEALDSLAQQIRYLDATLEWHLLGNHLLANAKALVIAGAFFDGPEADRWLQRGITILRDQLKEQILPDGGHFELSTMYHCVVLEDLLDTLNVLQASGLENRLSNVVKTLTGCIQRMRFWMKVMSHPDGRIAFFNDAAFDVAPEPSDLEAYASRLGLGVIGEPGPGVVHLPESGFVRLERQDAVVLLDVGLIGPDYLPGHAHADTLSFELSVRGQRVVVNSGTSIYGTGAERLRQRSTQAHSTVEVAGVSSSEVWGGFRVARRARPTELLISDNGADGLLVSCAHDGYRRLRSRSEHRRTWCLTAVGITIKDEVKGRMPVPSVARYHLHPQVGVKPGLRARSAYLAVNGLPVRVSSEGADMACVPTTYHPQFGVSVSNVCITTAFQDRVTHEFVWA